MTSFEWVTTLLESASLLWETMHSKIYANGVCTI